MKKVIILDYREPVITLHVFQTAKAGENQPKDFRVVEGVLGNALDGAELLGYQHFS